MYHFSSSSLHYSTPCNPQRKHISTPSDPNGSCTKGYNVHLKIIYNPLWLSKTLSESPFNFLSLYPCLLHSSNLYNTH